MDDRSRGTAKRVYEENNRSTQSKSTVPGEQEDAKQDGILALRQ